MPLTEFEWCQLLIKSPINLLIDNNWNTVKKYRENKLWIQSLRIKTLSEIIKKIIKSNKIYPGLFNLASKKGLSKKDFYILFFKHLNRNIEFKTVKVNSYLNTKRSKNMLMSVNKFEKKFKIQLPLVENEIKKEVAENYEKIKNW